jgi:hypothetical protein
MQKVDQATVEALELTAPGACRADARTLYSKLRSGQIFGAFGEQDREAIWIKVRACSTDRLIPSFFSFFQDLNWLKDPVNYVKRLMYLSPRETILYTLRERMFSHANQRADQCVIEESEHTYVSKSGNAADRVNLGILQIFFYAMRHCLEMPPEPKRKNLLAKPRNQANVKALYDFAAHAHRLGFESDEIYNLMHPTTPLPPSGAGESFF